MVLLQPSPNRYGVRIADDLGHGRSAGAAPEGLTNTAAPRVEANYRLRQRLGGQVKGENTIEVR